MTDRVRKVSGNLYEFVVGHGSGNEECYPMLVEDLQMSDDELRVVVGIPEGLPLPAHRLVPWDGQPLSGEEALNMALGTIGLDLTAFSTKRKCIHVVTRVREEHDLLGAGEG